MPVSNVVGCFWTNLPFLIALNQSADCTAISSQSLSDFVKLSSLRSAVVIRIRNKIGRAKKASVPGTISALHEDLISESTE